MGNYKLLGVLFIAGNVFANNVQEEGRIIRKLFESYDPSLRPSANQDGGVNVTTNMFVRAFEEVNTLNMDYVVDITFRQQWNDPRLAYDDANGKVNVLTLSSDDMVWRPDTFFRNGKEASLHDIPNKQTYLRVFPNGDVLNSMRLKVKLYCPMNLKRYPFDTQTCQLQIASYSWTKDVVSYIWKEQYPLQFVSSLFLPEMMLMALKTENCDVRTNTGTYSCLSANFVLARPYSNHILITYIPYMMIVILTWFTFWLKQRDSLLKVGINLLLLLWIVTKNNDISEGLPKVAYTKAIDVWTGWCTIFIFLAFVESVVVCRCVNESDNTKKLGWRGKSLSEKVDYISRIFFPVAFLLFTIIYFCTYISSDYDVCDTNEEGNCIQLW